MDTESAGLPRSAGSLPTALSSLVGRQCELQRLGALLRTTRLLTLAGTGGSGKTRLSLALASASRSDFRHGAWWVDLGAVTGRELIAGTMAAALDIPQTPGQDTTATVIRHLLRAPPCWCSTTASRSSPTALSSSSGCSARART